MVQENILDFMNSDSFEKWIDSLPLGICIVDSDVRVLHWNKTCERLHKKKRSELVGHLLHEVLSDAKQIEIVEAMKRGENKDIYYSENYNVIMTVSPVRDNEGELLGCISVEQDLSTYKRISEMLEEAQDNIKILKKELNRHIEDNYSFDKIVGKDPEFLRQKELCRHFADSKAAILLQGESGTGKEVFARAIHAASGRRGAFIALNCSAIPSSIFESELFGYERGSFTGADKNGRPGLIEAANQGTLFLDEIGEMPLDIQPKLLRVLEDGEITKVGGRHSQKLDVRIICATNRDLKQMAAEKTFRLDLYYRLSTLNIRMIPLRERKGDILILMDYFLAFFCKEYNQRVPEVSEEIKARLLAYDWEGNVRELKNCIERMVIMMKSYGRTTVSADDLPSMFADNHRSRNSLSTVTAAGASLPEIVEEAEKTAIVEALHRAEGSMTKAAEQLRIPRTSLYYKLKKYGINVRKEIDV